MELHAVYFPGKNEKKHARMARVLGRSVLQNSPSTPLMIHRLDGRDDELRAHAAKGTHQHWIDNARKAKAHTRIISEAADGAVLGMLDTDTMVLGDLSEIESMPFELAYTARPPGSKWKFNTGVYFVRVSEAVRVFVRSWYETVKAMLADPTFHHEWKKRKGYGGIHQAALGCMMETDPCLPKLLALPCEVWNCCSHLWVTAEAPKIVHLMSETQERGWCFGARKAPNERTRSLVEVWQQFDSYTYSQGRADYQAWEKAGCPE